MKYDCPRKADDCDPRLPGFGGMQYSPVQQAGQVAVLDERPEGGRYDAQGNADHYKQGGIECIEVLEQLARRGADFRILHAIRYLWRDGLKGDRKLGLVKAKWYLDRVIKELDECTTSKSKEVSGSVY